MFATHALLHNKSLSRNRWGETVKNDDKQLKFWPWINIHRMVVRGSSFIFSTIFFQLRINLITKQNFEKMIPKTSNSQKMFVFYFFGFLHRQFGINKLFQLRITFITKQTFEKMTPKTSNNSKIVFFQFFGFLIRQLGTKKFFFSLEST